jgi:hypothetical protein
MVMHVEANTALTNIASILYLRHALEARVFRHGVNVVK